MRVMRAKGTKDGHSCPRPEFEDQRGAEEAEASVKMPDSNVVAGCFRHFRWPHFERFAAEKLPSSAFPTN